MSSRSKPPERNNLASPGSVPDAALAELSRRHLRALAALGVRVVAVGFLAALLCVQVSWLGRHRGVLDALSGVLVLWPFFTDLGRLYAWRIALGRTYANAGRWAEAERALAPLTGLRGRLFDATGEGTYFLAVARRALGQDGAADALFQQLAGSVGGPWGERARAALTEKKERSS
jgi:hypothetical protein